MARPTSTFQPSVASVEASTRLYETQFCGRKTVWRVWGKGPPVILLHGGFGSWTHFLRLIPPLAADRMVICPDLPGYGDSDMPTSADLANAIPAALVDGLKKLTAPTIIGADEIDVIGFSFGTSIAGLLCRRLADAAGLPSPRGLALYGPTALGIKAAGIEGAQRLRAGLQREEREKIHAINLGLVMLAPGRKPDVVTIRLQDMNVRRARVRGRTLSQSGVLRDALSTRPVRALAAIWGATDPYLSGLHGPYREALLRDYPNASFLVQDGCGHWVQHEAPEAIATFTRHFLNAIPPRGSGIVSGTHQRLEPST